MFFNLFIPHNTPQKQVKQMTSNTRERLNRELDQAMHQIEALCVKNGINRKGSKLNRAEELDRQLEIMKQLVHKTRSHLNG